MKTPRSGYLIAAALAGAGLLSSFPSYARDFHGGDHRQGVEMHRDGGFHGEEGFHREVGFRGDHGRFDRDDRGNFSIYLGTPGFGFSYGSPDYYYAPPPPPSVYYYCPNPPGYYPAVSYCPSGWETVVPQPAY